MKKKIVGIFVCMLLIATAVLPVSGTVLMKRTSISTSFGGILYVGGSGPGNYSTIQEAIDDASDGDTVFVYDDSSPYYENLIVDKSIELIGENKQITVIDGDRKDDVVHIIADFVKISGFTIRYSSSHSDNGAGVRIDNSDNCIITDCKISQNGEYGVLIWNSYNCLISGNTISRAKIGILIEFEIVPPQVSYKCVIEENIINDTLWGIYVVRNRDVVKILNNIIVDNSCNGINTWNIYNSIEIKGNIISRNRVGVENSAHPQYRTHYITISENVISSNSMYGVLIQYSGHTIIYKNNFENNSVNAYFELHNLRFFGTNKWFFLLKGNYWDDWTGSGSKIIHGEILLTIGNLWSTVIPWKNYDRFPVQEPYNI